MGTKKNLFIIVFALLTIFACKKTDVVTPTDSTVQEEVNGELAGKEGKFQVAYPLDDIDIEEVNLTCHSDEPYVLFIELFDTVHFYLQKSSLKFWKLI